MGTLLSSAEVRLCWLGVEDMLLPSSTSSPDVLPTGLARGGEVGGEGRGEEDLS